MSSWQDKEKENITDWQAHIAIIHDVLCELGLDPGEVSKEAMSNGRRRDKRTGHNFELPNAESKLNALKFFAKTGRGKSMPLDYKPAGGGNVRIDLEVFYKVLVPIINEALKRKSGGSR